MPVFKTGNSNTEQSCNVMSTQTELATTLQSMEESASAAAEQESRQRLTVQQQLSFTEALNNLKAEVESLMKSRIKAAAATADDSNM